MSAARPAAAAGLFGKLPPLGDFVRRSLPSSFVEPWDSWLQEGMASSRGALGPAWLDCYLTSPIWRFALARGVCGPQAMAGVLAPSVDAVNRHFPLTIAAPLREAASPVAVLAFDAAWFARCDALVLDCLRADFDPASLEAALASIGLPCGGGPEGDAAAVDRPAPVVPVPTEAGAVLAWAVDLTRPRAPIASLLATLSGELADKALGRYGLWWSGGSEDVIPSLRIWRGLPPPAAFAALLCDRPARRAGAASSDRPAGARFAGASPAGDGAAGDEVAGEGVAGDGGTVAADAAAARARPEVCE